MRHCDVRRVEKFDVVELLDERRRLNVELKMTSSNKV